MNPGGVIAPPGTSGAGQFGATYVGNGTRPVRETTTPLPAGVVPSVAAVAAPVAVCPLAGGGGALVGLACGAAGTHAASSDDPAPSIASRTNPRRSIRRTPDRGFTEAEAEAEASSPSYRAWSPYAEMAA